MIVAAVVIFLVAFFVSVLGTFLARRWARRLGLMDDPGHRKVHVVATPRNGGIGIFWGFALPILLGVLAVLYLNNHTTYHMPISRYITGEGDGYFVAKI